jgi:hypothetical protein
MPAPEAGGLYKCHKHSQFCSGWSGFIGPGTWFSFLEESLPARSLLFIFGGKKKSVAGEEAPPRFFEREEILALERHGLRG